MTFEELQARLDVLRANLAKLDRIPQASRQEFTSDFRNLEATLHLLQTSIQALIDLGGYLVAQRALQTPRTSQDIFDTLEAAGVLSPGTATRCARIVGFRNRIVHLYDRVDENRVYEILTQHRGDIADVLDQLLAAAQGPAQS